MVTSPQKNDVELKSSRFRNERMEHWSKLEKYLSKIDTDSYHSLSSEEILELLWLYRLAISSLSITNEYFLEDNLRTYLDSLSFRAYLRIYRPSANFFSIIHHMITADIAQTFRSHLRYVLISALIILLGLAAGRTTVTFNKEYFSQITNTPLSWGFIPHSATSGVTFKTRLLSNVNTTNFSSPLISGGYFFFFKITSIMAIIFFGFSFGIPTILLLFLYGYLIGGNALSGTLSEENRFLLEYLCYCPFELMALILSGAAGSLIADNLVFPKKHSRIEHLRIKSVEITNLSIAGIILITISAIVATIVDNIRLNFVTAGFIGSIFVIFFILYFIFAGRNHENLR